MDRTLTELDHDPTELDHDPVEADLLPGGALGNHGIDTELAGVRPATAHTTEVMVTVCCTGGSGWHVDELGRDALYPGIGELVLRIPGAELSAEEAKAVAAWCHEGVPVRVRGLVGDTPTLVLDDGWRTVALPRALLSWTLSPA